MSESYGEDLIFESEREENNTNGWNKNIQLRRPQYTQIKMIYNKCSLQFNSIFSNQDSVHFCVKRQS